MAEERRIVTVLFADVTGSTALGEELDPEEVRSLLARYYEIAKAVVADHGGTLEKFIGDAVMAIFGLPAAHGDDAERAVAAALALRDRVRADDRLGRLAIRLGLATGEVVASRDLAAADFLVTGDAVNVAARIQQAAEPWQILATLRAAHAAAAGFEFGPERLVEARGKSAPVGAREVLRRRARPARPPTRAPLVGREPDLEQLQLVARRAFSERRPWLVSLIAPAGTGKTRLLEEFLDGLAEQAPAPRVATAQCLPYGQQMTYWPMRQVLFGLTGVSEDATSEEVRESTRNWLRGLGVEEAERVGELLAATIGAGESEAPDRNLLFAAWRTATEAASLRAPLVVVFEDLHWSSDSLLDLVEYLMQPRGEAPVLMIALTRPELLDRRPGWGGGRRNHLSLSLEPLSSEAIAVLVRNLLDSDQPDTVRLVMERSEGNPFYAGELVRALIEQGSLEKLPDTVQATVLARLDLLPPAERRLLQLGSVFGRSFRPTAIAALEPAVGSVDELCDQLTAKDLVRPGDGDRYAFRHILIREVAYQTLPRMERARLHAAAGDWLESRSGGREVSVSEVIAYHYREAAHLSAAVAPGEAETIRLQGKAVHWLALAAEVASAAAATPEAVRHLRAAIDLAAPSELAHLHERLGDCLGGDDGVAEYRTAKALYEAEGAPAGHRLRVLAGMLMATTRMQGSIADRLSEEQMQAFRKEGEVLRLETDDQSAIARFLAADAFYPFWVGGEGVATEEMIVTGEARAREALELAQRLGESNLASASLDALAGIATIRHDLQRVVELSLSRLEMEDRLNLQERIDAYSMIGWMSSLLGNLPEAERYTARGLTHLQPGQAPAPALHLYAWRLYCLGHLGRWDEVVQLVPRLFELWDEAGRIAAGYTMRGMIAALHVTRARQEPSAEVALMLRTICARYGESSNHPYRGLGAYADGDLDAVLHYLRNRPPVYPPEVAELFVGALADVGVAVDVEVLESVLEDWSDKAPLVAAQCRRALGLQRRDAALLAAAEEAFDRLGARPAGARARHELGVMIGDGARSAAGLRVLEELRDLRYVERHLRDLGS